MNTIDKIPTTKLARTGTLIKTGAKVGVNYLKYYAQKGLSSDTDKEQLNQDNARDIYDGLKSLKGSALKVAQMLSMEKSILPKAYVEKFSLAQFSVPALSAPLVRKTFKKYYGQYPEEIFDTFSKDSIHAASIGQVHRATLNGKELAVKIQYPGVAESVSNDLALVKPIAMKMFNLKGKDSDKYFKEVEQKLLEETNYVQELKQSHFISHKCSHISGLKFPNYYENLSNERIIVMDWMHGKHLSEWVQNDFNADKAQALGQSLWDFYMYQMHNLKMVHADPHPGNFLVDDQGNLIVIDFGCTKQIPDDFYEPYFELATSQRINDKAYFKQKLIELEILKPDDSPEESAYFTALFKEMISLFTLPFNNDTFDFGDPGFWSKVTALSEKYSKDTQLKKMNGNRGSKHFIYLNRTFFGLYHLLHDLKAKVKIKDENKYKVA